VLPIPPSYVFRLIEQRRRELSNCAGKRQKAGAMETTRQPLNMSKRSRPGRRSPSARWRHPGGTGRRMAIIVRKFWQKIPV
jgi:hypothetical protein